MIREHHFIVFYYYSSTALCHPLPFEIYYCCQQLPPSRPVDPRRPLVSSTVSAVKLNPLSSRCTVTETFVYIMNHSDKNAERPIGSQDTGSCLRCFCALLSAVGLFMQNKQHGKEEESEEGE